MNKIIYSIDGKDNVGEYNTITDDITIFLNNMTNPEEHFNIFITELAATEWHEIGHRYDNKTRCTKWYCAMTDMVWKYLMHGQNKWWKSYNTKLQEIAKKSNKSHRVWKNQVKLDATLQ